MTVTNVAGRFGTVILIGFLNLIISIFVVIMCGLVIFTQLLFIIFALYLPLNFILSMLPTYNGLLKKAVLKLFNTILMRAGLTLLITIAFSLSAMIYSMSGDYPFLMVAFLQIVVFVGTYLKMDEILSMVALGDGGSNKRGRFLKSMGRYMVMRKLFGRRYYSGGRRAAVSRSAGNGTGGGTGGNAGSSSGNEPAPSGESNSQRASSHTNNSGSKPVREPVRANENVNGTENNGASENERTTVSYGSKTQSAGTKAGKRVGMVMDSGKRLKERFGMVKDNVKNTPTEIKYQAGLHRKAMEQNVKDFKEGIAGERNRRETGRLQEQNRIQADAGRKRREM